MERGIVVTSVDCPEAVREQLQEVLRDGEAR